MPALPTPAPLRRLDDATLAVLRRGAGSVARAGRGMARWELARSPRPIRAAAAHPGAVAVLAGLLLVTGASVHLVRFPTLAAPEVVPAPSPPAQVGPPAGTDLDAYAAARHELLDGLDAEAIRAVISFVELVPIDAIPLPAAVRLERLQVLLPGEGEPREVAADGAARTLEDLFEDGRGELEREIADLEQLVREDLGDDAFAAEYRDRLEHLRTLRDRASGDAPVVFAAVVVAPAATLRELVDAPTVRLVDAAGAAERTRATRLTGVPPEAERARGDRDVAGAPPP